ncbi:hypothetical protein ETJ31_25200 [Salmonella enterica]|nr:hypothetical protein [Salmonella enterica]
MLIAHFLHQANTRIPGVLQHKEMRKRLFKKSGFQNIGPGPTQHSARGLPRFNVIYQVIASFEFKAFTIIIQGVAFQAIT